MPLRGKTPKEMASNARSAASAGCSRSPRFPSKAELRGGAVESVAVTGDGKLHLTMLSYCQDLGVYGSPFNAGKGVCCRMFYGDRPSPLYDFRRAVGQYVAAMGEQGYFPIDV